ncbi:MAG TPA: hypothetical protein VLR49_04640, partial [Ferruginibacter sp.]|nr:hypothetical protein [Ferruginibacter sp.]
MKYSYKSSALFYLLLIGCFTANAQQADLQVQFNKSYFKAKDSIHITALQPQKKGAIATLFLLAEHEDGMVWNMRWPMLNGRCEATLIIPDSLPQGQYRMHFSILQNLFTVFGKVKTPAKVTNLNTTLITAAGDVYESETLVNSEGSFTYKNVLFEKDATILFTLPEENNSDALNIEISTVLDSVAHPLAGKVFDIYIGETEPETAIKKFISKNGDSVAGVQVLEAVTVYSKPTNRGELFNKKYSSGLFRDMNERVINLLDDPFLNNSFSALQIVRNQVPGIMITGGIQRTARWRGDRVQFYMDEMRVRIEDIDMIPVNDIAIIKAYPPPFFGNPGGGGGAIAVYTKRGGLSDDHFKNAFKVKGY